MARAHWDNCISFFLSLSRLFFFKKGLVRNTLGIVKVFFVDQQSQEGPKNYCIQFRSVPQQRLLMVEL